MREVRGPLEWRFCARCETELEVEPAVCPACGYVAGASPRRDAEPQIPFSERYGPPDAEESPARLPRVTRARALVAAALIAVAALYASMMAINEAGIGDQARMDGRAPSVVTRP